MTNVDIDGDNCIVYSLFPEACGGYDTDLFTATDACCACGGGDYIEDPNTVNYDDCKDDNSVSDINNDTCTWYSSYPD
jgi:hypothetical protein